jgi:hypothetical protein
MRLFRHLPLKTAITQEEAIERYNNALAATGSRLAPLPLTATREELMERYNLAMATSAEARDRLEAMRVRPLGILEVSIFVVMAGVLARVVWDLVAHHGSARVVISFVITVAGFAVAYRERARPTPKTLLAGMVIGLAVLAAITWGAP